MRNLNTTYEKAFAYLEEHQITPEQQIEETIQALEGTDIQERLVQWYSHYKAGDKISYKDGRKKIDMEKELHQIKCSCVDINHRGTIAEWNERLSWAFHELDTALMRIYAPAEVEKWLRWAGKRDNNIYFFDYYAYLKKNEISVKHQIQDTLHMLEGIDDIKERLASWFEHYQAGDKSFKDGHKKIDMKEELLQICCACADVERPIRQKTIAEGRVIETPLGNGLYTQSTDYTEEELALLKKAFWAYHELEMIRTRIYYPEQLEGTL